MRTYKTKECEYCHKLSNKRGKTCPICGVVNGMKTIKIYKDSYAIYYTHLSEHFEGRPRPNCRYCYNYRESR